MKDKDILLVIDVQPCYDDSCQDIIYEVIEKMNNSDVPIAFFFVGRELEGDTKSEVIGYLLSHGLDESRIGGIRFIEKDYGFFRGWMDSGIPQEDIIKTLKYMRENDISDSRDLSFEEFKYILGSNYRNNSVYEGNPIFLPTFDERLFKAKGIDNLELIGGGRYECLLEIDIYLKSLDKKTSIDENLTYGRDDNKARFHKKNKKGVLK
jgi:hypothetical protein